MVRHKDVTNAIIALGSNVAGAAGRPADMLRAALSLLPKESISVQTVSRFYHTPAFPAGSGPDYVNAVAMIATPLAADDILPRLNMIEERLGRKRKRRWEARAIDLDLIAVGDLVRPDAATHDRWRGLSPEAQKRETPDRLILPHPRMQERAFVLVPMAEIAPEWRHPLIGKSVREMLADLPVAERADVRPLPASDMGANGLVKPGGSA